MYSGADGVGERQAPGQFRATRSEGMSVQAHDQKSCSHGEEQENLQGKKRFVFFYKSSQVV